MISFTDLPVEIRDQIYLYLFTDYAIRYYPLTPSANLRTYKNANPFTRTRFKPATQAQRQCPSILLVSASFHAEIQSALLTYSTLNIVGTLDMYELAFNCPPCIRKCIRNIVLIDVNAPYELATRFFRQFGPFMDITFRTQGRDLCTPLADPHVETRSIAQLSVIQAPPHREVLWTLGQRWPQTTYVGLGIQVAKYAWISEVLDGTMFAAQKRPKISVEVLIGFRKVSLCQRLQSESLWIWGTMCTEDWVLRLEHNKAEHAFQQVRFDAKNTARLGGDVEDYMTELGAKAGHLS